ncbi:MAG: lysophospholipid acyltransferase family protein [Terriglobales bacterium]
MLRTLLMLAFWTVTTPLAALVALPWALITGNISPLYAIGMWIVRTGVRLAGLRVIGEGLERLDPQRTWIFMSNHVSNLDPPVLLPLIPRRTSVLVKRELFCIPVLGQAMRIARLVPIDRRNRERAVSGLEEAAAVLRDGINMTVFVEGTRSPDGRLLPFKKGPFYLAERLDVPVVPVTILGTYEAQPKGRFAVRPGEVRAIFHAPLEPRCFPDRKALMEAVRDRIASALPPERR